MNHEKEFQQLLKSAFEPMTAADRDRWPQMARRLEKRSITVPWFEWALAAAALALLAFSPAAVPMLLNWL